MHEENRARFPCADFGYKTTTHSNKTLHQVCREFLVLVPPSPQYAKHRENPQSRAGLSFIDAIPLRSSSQLTYARGLASGQYLP